MLGDAGANALGAMLGAAAAQTLPRSARLGLLAGIVALTVASEKVSFTRVIAATPPLRWLDMLGRRPAPLAGPRSSRARCCGRARAAGRHGACWPVPASPVPRPCRLAGRSAGPAGRRAALTGNRNGCRGRSGSPGGCAAGGPAATGGPGPPDELADAGPPAPHRRRSARRRARAPHAPVKPEPGTVPGRAPGRNAPRRDRKTAARARHVPVKTGTRHLPGPGSRDRDRPAATRATRGTAAPERARPRRRGPCGRG